MQHLFKLWQKGDGVYTMSELATSLGLSTKQTARKLKRYAEDGWLRYTPGNGRGHRTQIQWLRNVEEMIAAHIDDPAFRLRLFKQLDAADVSPTLLAHMCTKLFAPQATLHTITMPIYSQALTLQPLEPCTTESAWVQLHTYSRLVDEEGHGDLAYHIEQRGTTYTFFIRPQAVWHNGQPITTAQIVASLKRSFAFVRVNDVLLRSSAHCVFIDFGGERAQLFAYLASVHFCIHYDGQASGAFQCKQTAADQYTLTVNTHYYLTKPLITCVVLQVIPATLERHVISHAEQLSHMTPYIERSGTCYVYEKDGAPAHRQALFAHFATQIAELDPLKKPLLTAATSYENERLRIGYVVNKPRFVERLRACGAHLEVTHLSFEQLRAEMMQAFDCVLVAQQGELTWLEAMFPQKTPLYATYRRMYYPKQLQRAGTDLYGYANLMKSYILPQQ